MSRPRQKPNEKIVGKKLNGTRQKKSPSQERGTTKTPKQEENKHPAKIKKRENTGNGHGRETTGFSERTRKSKCRYEKNAQRKRIKMRLGFLTLEKQIEKKNERER